jgi:hypothetical protein
MSLVKGIKTPKFLTLLELSKDHERLVGEVEALKKQFEGHRHTYMGSCADPYTRMTTEQPGKK